MEKIIAQITNSNNKRIFIHKSDTGLITDEFLTILEQNKHIIEFDFRGYPINNLELQKLCSLLKNRRVGELYLSNCDLNNMSLIIISDLLSYNTEISTLYLSNNKLDRIGITALSIGLSSNRYLSRLNLSACEIGDDISVLMKSLRNNNVLKELNISENNIREMGMKSIGEMLQYNNQLTNLEIDGNLMTDETVNFIAEGIKQNNTLEYIFLGHSDDDCDVNMKPIFLAVIESISLNDIDMPHSSLTKSEIDEMEEVLDRNINRDISRLTKEIDVIKQRFVNLYSLESDLVKNLSINSY